MHNRLLVIGRNLYLNAPYMAYIERELSHLGFVEEIRTIPEASNELVETLQSLMQKEGAIVIVANKNAFTPVSKIVATMIDDTLVLKEDLLIPSKSEIYDDNSFLVRYGPCRINVVRAEPGKTLPMLLVEPREREGLFHLFDMDEESAMTLLRPLAKSHNIEVHATLLVPGWLQMECVSRRYGEMGHFLKSAAQLFEGRIVESTNIFAYLVHRFTIAKKSVTFAESCTGGRVAARLTAEPGSSNIFRGSLVTYANALKAGWLGVEKETLERFGAVSEQCVEEMLKGALEVAQADYALAVSGIAGPGGGTPEKPVGTVYIGAMGPDRTFIERLHFEGDRNYIQTQSVYYAYKLLFKTASEILLDKNLPQNP
jgi:nicotinamide-nucleotide amidase